MCVNEHDDPEPSTRTKWLTLSTVGVIVATTFTVGLGVHRVIELTDVNPILPITATAAYLPLHYRHIWYRALGVRPRGWPWSLGLLALIVIAVIPIVGYHWLGALYPLATSVLLLASVRWAAFAFAIILLAPLPITLAAGQLDWAPYFMAGILMYGLSFAVPVWLIAAMRELRDTQELLAEKAVTSERLRIDEELQETVGAALTSIASHARRAGDLADKNDVAGADRELRKVVEESRRTLARARKLVRSYRGPTLRTELDTAIGLLRAADIEAALDLPDHLPRHLSGEARDELRSTVTSLLQDATVRSCVLAVTSRDDQVSVTVR